VIRRAPVRRCGGEKHQRHGQSAAAPVRTTVPLGRRIGAGKAQHPFECVAEPTGGQNVALQPSGVQGQCSGDAVSAQ
jgi:hypothetical protein